MTEREQRGLELPEQLRALARLFAESAVLASNIALTLERAATEHAADMEQLRHDVQRGDAGIFAALLRSFNAPQPPDEPGAP
jgi:hypothetical protein